MGLEAEVESLRRQNRRLKVALFSIIAVFLVSFMTVAGLTGIAAVRARAQTLLAVEREKQARAQAEAAFRKAQAALEQVEVQRDGEP